MTVEATPPAGTTPAGTTPSTPATPPAPAPAAAPTTDLPHDRQAFNDRIAQAKRAEEARVLKDLGVDSVEAAKAKIKAAKDAEDAGKTELQKKSEELAALKPQADKAARQEAVIKEHAARMMVGLSEQQQKAVKDLAGEDPAEQLRTITALSPTWAAQAAAAGATGASGGAAGSAGATGATGASGASAAATTAPPPGAPSGATPPPANARGQYEAAREANPFAAARFGQRNPAVYDKR